MNTRPLLNIHQPARYRVKIQGRVSADWTDWLSEVTVKFSGKGAVGVTCITGVVRDQAALFGFLSHVRDLGVPLVSVDFLAERNSQDECN